MSLNLHLVVHELLCAMMFYGAFCRAVWANRQTHTHMRLVILMTGSVASLGMLAPISWNYQPDWYATLLLTVSVIAQLVASRHWRHGIPEIFQRQITLPSSKQTPERPLDFPQTEDERS